LRFRTLLLAVVLPFAASGQIGLTYPYFLTSSDGAFYLKSIPHASQMHYEVGRTEVYRAVDSSIVYQIDKYLAPDGVVLSNDGQSILYTRSEMTLSSIDSTAVLELFRNGQLVRSYHFTDLLEKDQEMYYQGLFYFDRNNYTFEDGTDRLDDDLPEHLRTVSEITLSTDGVNAFIAARDSSIMIFDLSNGELIERMPFDKAVQFILANFTNRNVEEPEFNFPGSFRMPDLADGSSFSPTLAKHLGMVYDGLVGDDRYRYYNLKITALIDSDGNCIDANIMFEDSTKQLESLEFVLNQKFDSKAVPDIIEKWNFSYSTSLRKANKELAAREKEIQDEADRLDRLWRVQQDTLDGVYIPKDIDDCMKALDHILSDEQKDRFRKQDPIEQHFGLGLYIRNNWGLWSSSRLKIYMESFGLVHPDDMSAIILECYHAHLRGKPVNFENRVSRNPGQKIVPRQLIPPSELKFPFQELE